MRAIRMTLSLCHSVAEEHDLIVDVESRPERRRQEYIRALLVMAVESPFEGLRDLRPSGAAAATHRMVIHLNAGIPADDVILRFVNGGAAPVRRAELLRRLLVQARRLCTPTSAAALNAFTRPEPRPPRANGGHAATEAVVKVQAAWTHSTEIDVLLPDDEEMSTPTAMPDAHALTNSRSSEPCAVPVAKPEGVEPQRSAEMSETASDGVGEGKLPGLKGLFV